jgi:DNA-binding GntR family transcriptional regulator
MPTLKSGDAFELRGAITSGRAQDAYAHLLQELLEGELRPGDWLVVNDVANKLDCSRVPVMEAVKRLASDGFLMIVPQVGCRVVSPEPQEVLDFFALFAAVEGCVTRMAAERRTPDELATFKEVCARVDRLSRDAGPPSAHDPAYRRANLLFHSQIHVLAKSPQTCRVAMGMWDRSDFYIKVAFGSLHFNQRVRSAHLAIRRAIERGDADEAERAVEQHLRSVGLAVSRRLAERDVSTGDKPRTYTRP